MFQLEALEAKGLKTTIYSADNDKVVSAAAAMAAAAAAETI